MKDHEKITKCLRVLDKDQCISLGLAFGLEYPNLNKMNRYPEDVMAAWLRKEDNVCSKCSPTWSNLASALELISQKGIANEVRSKHCLPSCS